MTDLNKNPADQLSELRARFVQHERYGPLSDMVRRLVASRLADLRAGRVTEAMSLALTAGAGSGKSVTIKHLCLEIHRELAVSDFPQGKIVSVNVPSPATLKSFGIRILLDLGYDLTGKREAWYIWDLVRFHLRQNHVLFLHFDEAQDLHSFKSKSELPEIVNMLKSISQDDIWPVGFILSGTEDLKRVINFDAQLMRRVKGYRFEKLQLQNDAEDILALVASYCAAVGLRPVSPEDGENLGERIIHASAYEFGLAIKMTLEAIEKALYGGGNYLSREHFAAAFEESKSCGDAFNPFLIPDFTKVDPRKLFGAEGDL